MPSSRSYAINQIGADGIGPMVCQWNPKHSFIVYINIVLFSQYARFHHFSCSERKNVTLSIAVSQSHFVMINAHS